MLDKTMFLKVLEDALQKKAQGTTLRRINLGAGVTELGVVAQIGFGSRKIVKKFHSNDKDADQLANALRKWVDSLDSSDVVAAHDMGKQFFLPRTISPT